MKERAAARSTRQPGRAVLRGLPGSSTRSEGRSAPRSPPPTPWRKGRLSPQRRFTRSRAPTIRARRCPGVRQRRHHRGGRVRLRSRQRHLTRDRIHLRGRGLPDSDRPGLEFERRYGINGAGIIIGVYGDLAGVVRSFAISGGAWSNVGFPGASLTQAIGVNDAGQIVAPSSTPPASSTDSSATAASPPPSTNPGPPRPRPSGSTPPETSSDLVGCRDPRFLLRLASSLPSPSRSPAAPPPSASTTRGRSPAITATPPATPTVRLRRRRLQHRGRRGRPRRPPDPHQERRVGHSRVHRRSQ